MTFCYSTIDSAVSTAEKNSSSIMYSNGHTSVLRSSSFDMIILLNKILARQLHRGSLRTWCEIESNKKYVFHGCVKLQKARTIDLIIMTSGVLTDFNQ